MENNQQENLNENESLDRETLIQLLKEKSKEIKQTQKKLNKVEDKFVEMHKNQKNLINDRETFIQFLHLVFPQKMLEEEILLQQEGTEGFGQFDFNHLRQFWVMMTKNQENEQLAIVQAMQEEKRLIAKQLQEASKYDNKKEDKISKKENFEENKKLLESLQKENSELKNHLVDLETIQEEFLKQKTFLAQQEIKYLGELEDFQRQVAILKHENSEIKAKQLMSSFQNQQSSTNFTSGISNFSSNGVVQQDELQKIRLQLSQKTNEILQLQDDKEDLEQKYEQLYQKYQELLKSGKPLDPEPITDESLNQTEEKISIAQVSEIDIDQSANTSHRVQQLEEELNESNSQKKELENKLRQLLEEFNKTRTKAQQMLVERNNEIQKLRQKYSGKPEAPEEEKKQAPEETGELTSREYLKHVLLKYLEYQANGQAKETMMMEKVLFTVLKIANKEIEVIQEARVKNYNSGLMSYIWSADPNQIVAHPTAIRDKQQTHYRL